MSTSTNLSAARTWSRTDCPRDPVKELGPGDAGYLRDHLALGGALLVLTGQIDYEIRLL